MDFLQPSSGQTFRIGGDASWPSLVLQTDASGPHQWNWAISWGSYSATGTNSTPGNTWDAGQAVSGYGGTLTVTAQAGGDQASITVNVAGTNPTAAQALAYLQAQPGSAGFDKILAHESGFREFTAAGEPLKSFDNGYGMCQLTDPAPTHDQVWNWQRNIDGGLKLFAQKRAAAIAYLSQQGRTYTGLQVTYEAVCRWNGGKYHVWDDASGQWVRNPNILCDTQTGNIGWDMTDPANQGQTETQLHARDRTSYGHGPGAGSHWRYYGVCYADRLLV